MYHQFLSDLPYSALRRLWWGHTEAQLAGEVQGLAQGLELLRITAVYSVTQQAGNENQKMPGPYTQVLAVLSDSLGQVICPPGLHLRICTMGLCAEYE